MDMSRATIADVVAHQAEDDQFYVAGVKGHRVLEDDSYGEVECSAQKRLSVFLPFFPSLSFLLSCLCLFHLFSSFLSLSVVLLRSSSPAATK